MHDVNVLDLLIPEPGAFYVMDRAYVDFKRLYTLHMGGAFFIVRAKSNLRYRRCDSRRVDKSAGLRCDQTIGIDRRGHGEALSSIPASGQVL